MQTLVAEKFTPVHENALSMLFPARPLGLVQKFLLPLQRIGGTFLFCRDKQRNIGNNE